MTVRVSTGLRDALAKSLIAIPAAALFPAFFINYYSGSQPTTADDVPTGTQLAKIAASADGLTALAWEAAAGVAAGIIEKLASQQWQSAAAITTGTAGWFRMYVSGDAMGTSATAIRIDGSITAFNGGGDIELSSTAIVAGAPANLPTFSLEFPV